MFRKKKGRGKRMSHKARITQELREEYLRDFEKMINRVSGMKIEFNKTLEDTKERATLLYTPLAWTKQCLLIKEFSSEVAWHGVVERLEDREGNVYLVPDIMVYPQKVTGATVEMDDEGYAKWCFEHADDERYDNISFQGHSHVSMGTTPSSVDLKHQDEIMSMLPDDGFYVFTIWNKSLSNYNKIFDLKRNVVFENADITMAIVDENGTLDEFVKEAKTLVKSATVTPVKPIASTQGLPGNMKQPAAPAPQPSNSDRKSDYKPRYGAGWMGKDHYSGMYGNEYWTD